MQRTDNCVSSLVAAFTSGLDVFKKARERKREKKSKHTRAQTPALQEKSGEELILSKSLRRGGADIRGEYEKHYRGYGERFAVGDPIAQASLCETLLKLNTGLVNIISSFLRCGKKEVNLDYKSLISLSDTSRVEAVDALNRLSQRLSQSSFTTLRPSNHCSRCGKSRHEGKCLTKAASTELLTKKKHKHARACPRTKAAAQDQAAHIRKVQLYNASEPQLAMVKSRPRNHRVNSSSSANSPMPSPPPSYKSLSPPQSPPFPGYQAPNTGYFPPQYTPSPPLADPRHLRKNNPSGPANTPPPIPRKPTKYRTEAAKLAQLSSSQLNTMPQVQTPVVPRRQDKTTPSVYTFASDSTKLGEIPMDRWNVPYDWSAAERGNREAALKPVPGPPAVVLEGKGGGGKKGLFKGLFKKKDKEGGWLGSY